MPDIGPAAAAKLSQTRAEPASALWTGVWTHLSRLGSAQGASGGRLLVRFNRKDII